jgi:hypothetical protein
LGRKLIQEIKKVKITGATNRGQKGGENLKEANGSVYKDRGNIREGKKND